MTKLFVGFFIIVCANILLSSCTYIPQGVSAVEGFEAKYYLGTWYEIARTDNKFEKDLNNVTANYSRNDDGSIKVLNKGYNYVKNEWDSAEGKAKFRGEDTIAELKVSFFGPFYSGYNIVALDEAYQYALVMGKDLDYLWLLSRTTSVPDEIKEQYLTLAEEIGYDTSSLIWVEHDKTEE